MKVIVDLDNIRLDKFLSEKLDISRSKDKPFCYNYKFGCREFDAISCT